MPRWPGHGYTRVGYMEAKHDEGLRLEEGLFASISQKVESDCSNDLLSCH